MGILDTVRRADVESAFQSIRTEFEVGGISGMPDVAALDTDFDFGGNLDSSTVIVDDSRGPVDPNFPRATLSETRGYAFGVTLPPDPRRIVSRHLDTKPIVRRPTTGLIGFEERYSRLEVIVRDGDSTGGIPVRLINSSYPGGYANVSTNFFVQSIAESSEEAMQVVETFNDFYLADVGEKPQFLQVNGMLLAAKNFPWAQEWRKNYDRYLRGRQCILRRAMVYLTICDEMYVGYVLNSSMNHSVTDSFWLVPFSFTMVLRDIVDVRAIQDAEENQGRVTGDDESSERDGSVFVAGIRIPDTVTFGQGVTSQAFSPEQQESIEDKNDDVREPLNLRNAQVAEIIQGELEGMQRHDAPILQWKEGIDRSLTQWNLARLLALTRSINERVGTNLYDLQRVAVGYAARFEEDLRGAGLYDEYGPATFGLPTEYQSQVDARRRRQQEELLERGRSFFEEQFGRIDWL